MQVPDFFFGILIFASKHGRLLWMEYKKKWEDDAESEPGQHGADVALAAGWPRRARWRQPRGRSTWPQL